MQLADLMPYLLGGGAFSLLTLALTWRRRDAKDAVDTANANVTMAIDLRDKAAEDAGAARAEVIELRARVHELEVREQELEDQVLAQGRTIAHQLDEIRKLKERNALLRGDEA